MRRLIWTVAVLLLASLPLTATGTVTVTSTLDLGNVARYTLAWTSTAGGAVSGNALTLAGRLVQIKFVPNTSTTQPTDLYDVTLVDSDGLDVLTIDGVSYGANLSNATPKLVSFTAPIVLASGSTLDLTIANAGNAKTGTVILWVQR